MMKDLYSASNVHAIPFFTMGPRRHVYTQLYGIASTSLFSVF